MKTISVIIPAKDEEDRIQLFLDQLIDFAKKDQVYNYEIIVVDDGSKDNTIEILQKYGQDIQIIQLAQNFGKGFALARGFEMAKGDPIVFMDADGSTQAKQITEYLDLLDDYDVIIGSRVLADQKHKIQAKYYRQWMGSIFNFMVRTFLIKGVADSQCGFKMFKADIGKQLFAKSTIYRFGIDLEILYLAQKMQYRIKEVPINWTHIPGSKVHLIRDSFTMLVNIFQILKRHKHKQYNQ